MKKILLLAFPLLLCLGFISCNSLNIFNKEKTSLSYHTDNLGNSLKKNSPKIRILDMNIYSELIVDEEDIRILSDLIFSLKDDNFIPSEEIPKKPLFKLFVDVGEDKYVLDIFGDDLITIYPWDSHLEKDYISLKDVPNAFKLEPFCHYAFNKKEDATSK